MKEYVVVANDEPSIDQLHLELTNDTTGNSSVNGSIIPNRPVEAANLRLANPRITHYFLTDSEAISLSEDPRVTCVNIAPTKDMIKSCTIDPTFLKKTQQSISFDGHEGNFNRIGNLSNFNINWGLRRTSLKTAEFKPTNNYNYDVDGRGVDIIISDDGIELDHPEFLDSTGACRIQQIDWYKATGLPGQMPAKHYSTAGLYQAQHGTHVASIAAGKTFGYAKNSRIFSMRVLGNDDQTIDLADLFDLIRIWHSKKPLDTSTGSRRPTVLNMSWGFIGTYPEKISGIYYRSGQINYDDPVGRQDQYGQVSANHGYRVPSIDIEAQMCEDAGVVIVRAAGNNGHKIDKLGNIDYENYYTNLETWMDYLPPGYPIYYQRGASPMTNNIINVSSGSNVTILSANELKEQLDAFSDRGPGCDIVAPGNSITSASSKNSGFGFKEYVWGTADQKVFNNTSLSGTSQAAPQVAGVVALHLSRHPEATPADVKKWIRDISMKDQLISNDKTDDWNNPKSLLGGPNNYLYNPFHNGFRD